jgi:hypothetical protein
MAKNPGRGQCVHCLKGTQERNWDHVFPKSWYPDTTGADTEKWQIPSCLSCNDRYGKLECDLIDDFLEALSDDAIKVAICEFEITDTQQQRRSATQRIAP